MLTSVVYHDKQNICCISFFFIYSVYGIFKIYNSFLSYILRTVFFFFEGKFIELSVFLCVSRIYLVAENLMMVRKEKRMSVHQNIFLVSIYISVSKILGAAMFFFISSALFFISSTFLCPFKKQA